MLAELTYDQIYLMACPIEDLLQKQPPKVMSPEEVALLGIIPEGKIGPKSYVQMVRDEVARDRRQARREKRQARRRRRQEKRNG